MEALARDAYGGNLSAAVEDALRDAIESKSGPLSKIFAFNAELRTALRRAGLKYEYREHAVDWIIPSLRLGIEGKVKFSPGTAEKRVIAAMAFTVGQKLADEIWIVGADTMSGDDRMEWDRVSREFHLCRVRFVFASTLEAELKRRKKGHYPEPEGSELKVAED